MLVTHSGAVFGTKISYILDAMSVGATGLWHVFVLSLIYKKIYKKNCCNLQCFQEKNYTDNFRKKIYKKTKGKKPCRETL